MRRLARLVYERIKAKYPEAMRVYTRYKMYNEEYHAQNRYSSIWYLFRLVAGQRLGRNLYKVRLPRGTANPYSVQRRGFDMLLPCKAIPDTELIERKSTMELADELEEFSVISFDVFDTLIFRPFESPTDMFYLLGEQLRCFDFKALRISAEAAARENSKKANGEINIYDIYDEIARRSSLTPECAETEIALETELCYANPYMLELFKLLRARNKKIVIVSDMYLPCDVIERILKKNGYEGYLKLYVSCEYGHNKTTGKLFSYVKRDFGNNIIHVGDSMNADVRGAARAKISSYYYHQCNEFGRGRRPTSLVSPVSSVYKGIVNNTIYNGGTDISARESFGFIYGGLIVCGFCEWINEFAKGKSCDKIFFLARDMHIFHKIYNRHYGQIDNEYVTVSRFALQELMIEDYPLEYFRHTVRARSDRGYTVKRTLSEINLDFLLSDCDKYGINPKDIVIEERLPKILNMLLDNKSRIVEHFLPSERAAKKYFKRIIGDAKRICVADLGWRGSILAYLKFLLVDKWHLCDEVYGVLVASTVSDTSVELISDGTVTSYAFNHVHNRDFLSTSNWNSEYIRIMMLESVFTSEDASLLEYRLNEEKECEFVYCPKNPNAPIIKEFSRGIERFADEFEGFRRAYRDVYPITAVDAFEPMFSISENYEYIARIIGDVVDTPFALAGHGIVDVDYVPLGELMHESNMIKEWPIK